MTSALHLVYLVKREHQDVVAALEAADVDGLRDVIVDQINTTRDRILAVIMQGDLRPVQVSLGEGDF